MKAKSIILIVIALGCGLVASIGISQVVANRGGSGTGKVKTTKILVAVADLDINEAMTADNVRLEDWPTDRLPDGALSNWDAVKGQFTRIRVVKGQAVVSNMLSEDQGIIRVKPGYRVIPIRVSSESVASFVLPGDRVDIMVVFRPGEEVTTTTAKTVLQDVVIYAVNERIEREVKEGESYSVQTVSVMVKPEHAEMLALVSEMGKMRLTLRNPAEDPDINVSKDGTKMQDVFASETEIASDREPGGEDEDQEPKSFDDLVDQIGRSEGLTPSEPAHRMQIITPNGGSTYTWWDLDEMPEVTQLHGGAASSATAAFSDPPNRNTANSDPGQRDSADDQDSNDEEPSDDTASRDAASDASTDGEDDEVPSTGAE